MTENKQLQKEDSSSQSPPLAEENYYNVSQERPRIYEVTAGIQSKYTRITYQHNFDRFLNKINIHDLQVLLDFSPKVIKEMIIDYIHYLSEEKQLRRDSIKTQVASIIHFFKINNDDFNLRMDNFKLHLPPDESISEDRPYTVKEISQVISVCDLRTRVAILLLCSSGMRMGALHSLQIGDLQKIGEGGNPHLYKVQVYARTRDKYLTFTTPEATKTIDEYLQYRKRYGEELKDKSPLIREQFNPDNPFTINSPRFVTDNTIEYILNHALKQSGVSKPREVHMSHGFRKHFMTVCEQSGMRSINVKMLLGHDIGVSGHYYRPAEADILEDYMNHAADNLTIDPTQRLQKKVQQLESEQAQEISRLKAQLLEYREDAKKIKEESDKSYQLLLKVTGLDKQTKVTKRISKKYVA